MMLPSMLSTVVCRIGIVFLFVSNILSSWLTLSCRCSSFTGGGHVVVVAAFSSIPTSPTKTTTTTTTPVAVPSARSRRKAAQRAKKGLARAQLINNPTMNYGGNGNRNGNRNGIRQSVLVERQQLLPPRHYLGDGTRSSEIPDLGVEGSSSSCELVATSSNIINNNNNNNNIFTTKHISKSDHDATLTLLQSLDWSMVQNTSRRNVIRKDDPNTPRKLHTNKPYCRSFIFGPNMKDPTGALSYWSIAYPNIYNQLCQLIIKYDPMFTFTHITVNKNLQCARHTDGGNTGLSYIAGFGSYIDGQLLIGQQQQQILPGGGGEIIEVKDLMLDLHSKFVLFDGKTQPHETLPFTGGDRYTLVYYTSDMGTTITKNDP